MPSLFIGRDENMDQHKMRQGFSSEEKSSALQILTPCAACLKLGRRRFPSWRKMMPKSKRFSIVFCG
jgi:hypothetical protein